MWTRILVINKVRFRSCAVSVAVRVSNIIMLSILCDLVRFINTTRAQTTVEKYCADALSYLCWRAHAPTHTKVRRFYHLSVRGVRSQVWYYETYAKPVNLWSFDDSGQKLERTSNENFCPAYIVYARPTANRYQCGSSVRVSAPLWRARFPARITACYRLGAGSELFKQEKKLKKAMSITTAPDNNPVERRHFREPARVVADSFGILVFLAYC